MGLKWGQIAYVRGQTRYTISQYEQNAFHGVISSGFPKMLKRIQFQIPRILPREYCCIAKLGCMPHFYETNQGA